MHMKNSTPLYLYGSIIMFEGIFLFFSMDITFNLLKLTLGIGLLIGSVFAFLTALTRQKRQVQFAYHELHAMAMMVYGINVLLFANTLEMLFYFTALLFFFYAFSEIIFSSWLFNLRQEINYKTVFFRMFLALLVGLGTALSFNYTFIDMKMRAVLLGVIFIMIGLNVIFYIPVMKKFK